MSTFDVTLNNTISKVAEFMQEHIIQMNKRNVHWSKLGGVPNEWFYRFTYTDKIKKCECRVLYTKAVNDGGDGIRFTADVDLIGELESGRKFSTTFEGVEACFRVNSNSDYRLIVDAEICQYKLLDNENNEDSDWIYFGILPNGTLVDRAISRLSDSYWRTDALKKNEE